jgi:ketosteroid isomerase-like protein
MSQENVEATRASFERFARGDFSESADLPDDYEIVTAPEMPDAGIYRGEAARTWFNAWVESFDSLMLEPVEILDAGDRVVVEFVQRGTPRGGSTPVELRSTSEARASSCGPSCS